MSSHCKIIKKRNADDTMFSLSVVWNLFFKQNGKEETPQSGKEAQGLQEAQRLKAPPLTQNFPDTCQGSFGVEPRGIEPLYPNDNCGFLTLRWPRIWLHEHKNITNENPSRKARIFGDSIESAIVI